MSFLIAALSVPMVAACSVVALMLLGTSALRFSSAGRTDPSDEARSVVLAIYGCVIALMTLGLFVTLL
ncbi:hypothetical protein [Streptomyces albipurpureus]|uniref:DUF4190 domain-containing protein n=1 Tax=Streptomyces albipurpureus TaxID=2897419 RepID=A0ABT0UKD6_9ACTN|nr:hypothetical protein [Streptomyces sp. CWNU-1]MCM2388968.1 hypothetical protein [Streptomyces sp. CWNU-1]